MPTRLSPAFRSGFAAGFSSPYRSMFGARIRISPRCSDLVTESWEQVGLSMRFAIEREMERHDAPLAKTEAD